jgi:hypothetical protein
MEIATPVTTRAPGSTVPRELNNSPTSHPDLQSIAECVEAALAQVTFTREEIEGVLAQGRTTRV